MTRSRYPLFAVVICVFVLAIAFATTPPSSRVLLLNSLKLAIATGLVAMPLSFVVACSLREAPKQLRVWLEFALVILLFFPLYIQLAGWEAGIGRGGWYSTLVARRLSEPPLEGFRGAVWVHAMAAVPWLYWMIRLGLDAIPGSYIEAAKLDASWWQVFRRIIWPLALPTVLAGGLFVGIVTMSEITITDRYQYRSFAEVIYNEFALNPSMEELPLELSSLVFNLLLLVGLGLVLCRLLGPKFHGFATVDMRETASPRPKTLAMTGTIIVLVLLLFPLGNLAYQAGIEVLQNDLGQRSRSWSATKCLRLIMTSPWIYRIELAWSVLLAQLTVLSTVTLATLWAWWSRNNKWLFGAGMLACIISFATPGTFIGLSLIRLLNRPDSELFAWLYDDTILAPWIATTAKSLPFACLLIWYGVQRIPQQTIDLARTDGASQTTMLTQVVLPLMLPSLTSAALVTIAISIGELSASILVLPLSVTTVSSRIFNLIHYGADDQLAGLCLSCVLLMATLAWFLRIALKRSLLTGTES